MPSRLTSPRVRSRLGGAAMAALAAVLLAPEEARARCSHGSQARPIREDRLSFLENAGALVDDVGQPARDAGRRGGCSGPSCSGKSGLPVVPASVLSPRLVQWAALKAPPVPPGLRSSRGVDNGRVAWTNPSADAVFHPPRAASRVR